MHRNLRSLFRERCANLFLATRRLSLTLPLALSLIFQSHAAEAWQAKTALPPPLPQATQGERSRHLAEQERYITPDRYNLQQYPLIPRHEAHWRRTLWATALREPDSPELVTAFETILPLSFVTSLNETESRILEMTLQVSYQYYGRSETWRERLTPLFQDMVTWSPHPRWVAMALSALSETSPDLSVDRRQAWIDLAESRLPEFKIGDATDRLLLELTLRHLRESSQPLPPLEDWVQWQIAAGEPQLFVFCEPERSQLCYTLLQDGQGRWLPDRQNPKQPWSVPLSGRSLHGLPWYLSRGETPQGVYRIEGFIPQPDTDFFYAYGFFPLVNLYVPHEAGVDHFRPQNPGTITTLRDYQTLLPPRWRSRLGIQESYWAGQLGRGLFRIHGTGEAPDFFVNNDRFPDLAGWNPAIGCLSALEQYDDQGNLLRADMPAILEALQWAQSSPGPTRNSVTGYVIVLNVEDPKAIVQAFTQGNAPQVGSRGE
ncbi:MAG: hypothetical protein RLZZ435_1506 [Cyanobacteriota bacterium]|jgi:hypothetical protein